MATQPPVDKPAPAAVPTAKPIAKPMPAQAVPAQTAAGAAPPPEEAYEDQGGGGTTRFILFNAMPSWMVSMVVHTIAIVVLALFTFSTEQGQELVEMIVPPEEEIEEIEEFTLSEVTLTDTPEFESTNEPVTDVQPQQIITEVSNVEFSDELEAAPIAIELADFSDRTAPKNDLLAEIGTLEGTGLSGRGAALKGDMAAIKRAGGNEASERAVAAALKWLAEHQLPDGGWSFDHTMSPYCRGQCTHAGTLGTARNGATAMALLPFLGAGQTHMDGKYKAVVKQGLAYLMMHQKPQGTGGSFHEGGGSMYSHGLCAITLCEAYAMTHDKGLQGPAQASLNFIVDAQDPVGGGWRYSPRTPGDTSVVGWQLMALKSGHMGYLVVPPNVVRGSVKFLDHVSAESGAFYGYTDPAVGRDATTAVGLLCRMYLGWDKTNPALERGVQWISERGVSGAGGGGSANMYYNYYATQVIRHWGGEEWEKWNTQMRDWLVESQGKEGHETGSWNFSGGHGERGGRLYNTSMATMMLEVYYRHMPIYKQAAAKDDFPL